MGSTPNSTAARPDGTCCSPQYTSAYVPKNGRTPSTVASRRSVRSERPWTAASASRPTPASANRTPAPSIGGVSSSPILIATQVLDQMATSRAYSDQTTGRLIEPPTLAGGAALESGRTLGTAILRPPMTDLDRAVQTV